MSGKIRRREFVRRAGVLGAGALGALGPGRAAPAALRSVRGGAAPNETIRIGHIGVGNRGSSLQGGFQGQDDVEVVAVCDVHTPNARRAARRARLAGTGVYTDFRNLLDRDDVDAIVCATPDHWHTLVCLHALRAGKDIYCEKPLTLFIDEGKLLVQTAREQEAVFQVGSQQRSAGNFRHACELVRNGHIGSLVEVETRIGGAPRGQKVEPRVPPPGLHWNLWLGPAPWAPFHPKRCFYDFRWFWDYSGGKMTDWGAHHNDIAQWGLGMEYSGPVEAEGKLVEYPPPGHYETATRFLVEARYATGVKLVCKSDGENGILFRGTGGEVFVSRGKLRSNPDEIHRRELADDDLRLYRSDHHIRDFLDCVKSRERPVADVEIGHRSVSACHLFNIAMRLERKIRWDPVREEIVDDDDEAAGWLRRPYREPWKLA